MFKIIFVILLVILIIGFAYGVITIYNKMITLASDLTRDYYEFHTYLQEQMSLATTLYNSFANLNQNAFAGLRTTITNFDNSGSMENIINTYISIDNELNQLMNIVPQANLSNWINSYNNVKMKIKTFSNVYNEKVKEFNRILSYPAFDKIANNREYHKWPRINH